MNPDEASAIHVLDEQANLLRWMGTSYGKTYLDSFADSFADIHSRKGNETSLDPRMLRAVLADSVRMGTPYYVSPNMVALAEHAALTLGKDSLHPSDPVSPHGFMYLSKGIIAPDARGKPVSDKAMTWAPCVGNSEEIVDGVPIKVQKKGVFVAWYSDTTDDRDTDLMQLREDSQKRGKPLPRLLLLHYGALWYDQPWNLHNDATDENVHEPDQSMRFLFTAWMLMKQRLAWPYDLDLPRHFKRRAQRAGLAEPSKVKIITLRRSRDRSEIEGPDYVPGSVEWSHQWLVDSFWRWQWYPSEGVHKQILILPYVKGPTDKPLVIKQNVYHWKR